jgi:hypothetical protein
MGLFEKMAIDDLESEAIKIKLEEVVEANKGESIKKVFNHLMTPQRQARSNRRNALLQDTKMREAQPF